MVELAEIFRIHGAEYREKFADRMLASHLQAMEAIEQCRTEALGGHIYWCESCEEHRYSYHSCKNRHCPKCQNDQADEWLQNQKDLLLPVAYFMVTFTVPEELRELVRSHQKTLYNILFRSSAAALQELAHDPRFIGGQIGMLGVLHTWTRELLYHPHVHYLVPGGGHASDGSKWRPSGAAFLVHVKPLAVIFRAKFRDALKRTELFPMVASQVWNKGWVVDSEPVGSGAEAFRYLAPYVFRVAISNNRILKLEEGKVTFEYKESATGRKRRSTLTAEEFIRRFLQHVLPHRFIKVRYYGFLAPSNRHLLGSIRARLGAGPSEAKTPVCNADLKEPDDALRCPKCGGILILVQTVKPKSRLPP